jgi:GNAT superfamily N-acetyltransferase
VPVETDEPLETGYGEATPPGDNVCNDFVRGLADAYSALARARGHRVLHDGEFGLCLTDGSSPSLFANMAVLRRPLSDADWRRAAERMHAFYGERPGGSFLLFSAWPTPDLIELDFGRIGHPPLMLRPPAPLHIDHIEGLEIRSVKDARGAEDWERALVDGFPEQALQPFSARCFLPEGALKAEGWTYWVAYLDGRPAGTASAHMNPGFVHVEFISTVESARGRGIGRALTATATAAETELPAMLLASDLGRPVYERLGYRALLRFTFWAGHRRPAELQ